VRILHELSPRSGERWWRSTAPPSPTRCSRASCSATRRAPSPAPAKTTRGKIEPRITAASCSSTRSAICPMSLQAKLLRFLQERVIERHRRAQGDCGGCARGLRHAPGSSEQHIIEGRFREDLYYRINEATIHCRRCGARGRCRGAGARLPVTRFAGARAAPVKTFDAAGSGAIEQLHMAGQRARTRESGQARGGDGRGAEVTAEDMELEEYLEDTLKASAAMPLNLRQVRETAEKTAIVQALTHTDDNITEAAELLGVTRPTLYSMLEKYGLRTRTQTRPPPGRCHRTGRTGRAGCR
jgi:two-component system NtrC family response regulator